MNEQVGYSQERLVAALSILGETKKMLEIMHRVAGSMIAEQQTDESQRFMAYCWSVSGRATKTCSKLIQQTSVMLTELEIVKNLVKDPPPD
jgi:hypothetical protein